MASGLLGSAMSVPRASSCQRCWSPDLVVWAEDRLTVVWCPQCWLRIYAQMITLTTPIEFITIEADIGKLEDGQVCLTRP